MCSAIPQEQQIELAFENDTLFEDMMVLGQEWVLGQELVLAEGSLR
ncbi:MAG: hypothetical protein HC924_01380 [Synechococcaceae cyanobacterium SM2_3_2]|nr:hypothetical protein [Synechococcaceae cyanobacterium SM2_3_2]